MFKVNINERASIEEVYPYERFEQDAGRNSIGNASVLHGLKIMSQPDADGTFELTTAKHQVGERNPEGDTVFLPPYLMRDSAPDGGNAYAGQQESGDVLAEAARNRADYASYIDRVLAQARVAHFKAPIGNDPRLAGFHGG